MQIDVILQELEFKAIRSSGPGGQHVNKTASKIEVSFSVISSQGLSESEKDLIESRLSSRLTKEGVLILQCGESRSQHRNKRIVIDRLIELLQVHSKAATPRKKSRPSRSAIEKRLKVKKGQSQKKLNRKPPSLD